MKDNDEVVMVESGKFDKVKPISRTKNVKFKEKDVTVVEETSLQDMAGQRDRDSQVKTSPTLIKDLKSNSELNSLKKQVKELKETVASLEQAVAELFGNVGNAMPPMPAVLTDAMQVKSGNEDTSVMSRWSKIQAKRANHQKTNGVRTKSSQTLDWTQIKGLVGSPLEIVQGTLIQMRTANKISTFTVLPLGATAPVTDSSIGGNNLLVYIDKQRTVIDIVSG